MKKVKEFLNTLRDFFHSPSRGRSLAIIGIIILAAILPVTVIVLQSQTQTQQNARLYCGPSNTTYQCGSKSGQCSNHTAAYTSDRYVKVTFTGDPTCVVTCQDQGRVAGKCNVPSACVDSTSQNVCQGNEWCKKTITVNHCSFQTTTSYDCSGSGYGKIDGKCGYKKSAPPSYSCLGSSANPQTVDTYFNSNDPAHATLTCPTSTPKCDPKKNGSSTSPCVGFSSLYKTPQYVCNGTGYKDSISGYTYQCPSGTACKGGPYSTLNGASDVQAHLCTIKYAGCTNFFVGSDQLEINCQNEAKKQRASCTSPQYYKYSGDSCVFSPPATVSPSPAQLPLPDPSSIRCGTTSNPGVCYFYRSSAIPGVGCDPNAYSNTPGHACDSSSFQNLPSCDTMVKSATGYSGSQNINSNSSCLAVKVSGFTSNVDQNVIHAQCCSLIAVNKVTPSPSQDTSKCTAFEGMSDYTDASCQNAAKSVRSSCPNPQNYRFAPAQYTNGVQTVRPQCIYNLASTSSNVCTQHGGSCRTGSSQGITCNKVLTAYNSGCDTKNDQYCCGDTPVLPTCESQGGSCTSNNSCGSKLPLDGVTCSTGSRCCVSNPSTHNYGTCAGLDSSHSICTDTKCPSGFAKTASNACSGKTSNGLTKICCTRNVSTGSGGTGGTGGSGGSSCTNGKSTSFTASLKLEGIGTGSFDNHTPAHPTRTGIYVKVTDETGASKYNNTNTTFTFNPTAGTFSAPAVSLGTSSLTCGHTYTLTIKIPRYLPVKTTLTYGNSNAITLNPLAGDINKVDPTSKVIIGDDKIDINDYALVSACHNVAPTTTQNLISNTTTVSVTCSDLMNFFDYTDGGTQDDEWSFNYNLWLRSFVKAP